MTENSHSSHNIQKDQLSQQPQCRVHKKRIVFVVENETYFFENVGLIQQRLFEFCFHVFSQSCELKKQVKNMVAEIKVLIMHQLNNPLQFRRVIDKISDRFAESQRDVARAGDSNHDVPAHCEWIARGGSNFKQRF